MFRRRVVLGLVFCLLAVLIAGRTLSQPQQRGLRGGLRGGARDSRGSQGVQIPRNIPDMRKVIEDRIKQQLGSSDAEWKTLGPSVMKVLELKQQMPGGNRGGMYGNRRAFTGNRYVPRENPTELDKAMEQLRTVIRNESAKSGDIEKQLVVFRAAREKCKKQLAAEQQKLQKQVTVRQKAQLVLMGLLE